MTSNKVIQGLWIGDALSAMERLSIASFLAHGHDYHLYVYEPLDGIPAGTTLRDAAEILPRSRAFMYSEQKSWSGFSNFFRYKLLLERGGWWFDTDFVCLHPIDFAGDHVFASEFALGRQMVTSGAIKAPAGSAVMQHAWDVCQSKDPSKLVWGETGPALMEASVEKFSMYDLVQPWKTFCPYGYKEWEDAIRRRFDDRRLNGASTLHLWHEQWRAKGRDKNRRYYKDSLYERLRLRYLPDGDRDSSTFRESVRRFLGR